jgi:hypothetical protein
MNAVEPMSWSEPVAQSVDFASVDFAGDGEGVTVPLLVVPLLALPESHPVRNVATTRAQDAAIQVARRPFTRGMPIRQRVFA